MLSNEKWFGAEAGFYPETIDQSLRLDGTSAHLSKTYSTTASSTTDFVMSLWFKAILSGTGNRMIASSYDGATVTMYWQFQSERKLRIYIDPSSAGSNEFHVTTDMVFRDSTNWYNICLVLDMSQSSNVDKAKIYVNGTQASTTQTYSTGTPTTQNVIKSGTTFNISKYFTSTQYIDGYIAEVNIIDGSANYTDFGESKNGVWIPKAYTGSYGNNGARLTFADSSSLGDDTSGNGNDFTSSGLASTDVYTDSPTNNLATLNPLYEESTATLSEGNLKISGSSGATEISTIAFRGTQKFYYEVKIDSISSWMVIGILETDGDTSDLNPNMLTDSRLTTYGQGGSYYTAGSYTSSGGFSYTTNDIVGILFDNGTMTAYKNGVAQTPVQSSISTSKLIFAYVAMDNASQGMTLRFAEQDWTQAPTGVDSTYELSSTNLDDTTLSPNQTENASDYFDTTTWSGDNTDTRNITDYDFQPDWAWIKNRNTAISHVVFDSVRGVSSSINTALSTNVTDSEGLGDTITTSAQFGGISAFLTNGFTLKEGNTDDARYTNKSGSTYVGWAWKAGGTAVSNTDGTITSSVSASTEAGFSIATYTGTGSLGTVGHGLTNAPAVVIIKKRSASGNWVVGHHKNGFTGQLYFDTGAFSTNSGSFNNTAPTSTVVTINTDSTINTSSATYVMYCFTEVEGYSKFGSYTGNGSTDGTYVHLGFRPQFMMFKRTDTTGNWFIKDNKREPFNVMNINMHPNLSNAEGSPSGTHLVDGLSNGFKLKGSGAELNASGGTYIYMAFAEQPFKFSNAR